MLEKGTVLSQRYELLTFLGKGGMSEVWKARHIHLDKLVAVKLLNKDLLDKQEFQARFKQEAQISSRLSHPNICSVSDFGFTEDGTPFIVMEYLEGESLASILKRIERLPVGASLIIVKQTLSGLKAAHKIGVIHRDIKPGNIFIVKDKSGVRLSKILDFGISKMVAGNKSDLGLTTTGTLLGTAFYLSPEQIMESRGVDHRTDIYACGAVFYKMITGKVPYMGENFGEVAVKVVNDPLVDPRSLVAGLAGSVSRIIKKCLEKDPRSRYSGTDDALADIDRILEDYQGDTIDALYKPGIESLILKPIERKPSRFTRKLKIAAIGTTLSLLLGAAALFMVFTMNNSGKGAVKKTPGPAKPGSSLALGMGDEKGAAGAPAKAGKVSIAFKSLPPGAKIAAGNEEYYGSTVIFPRSTESVTFVISAEDYRSKDVILVPNSDMEVDGALEPAPPAPAEETTAAPGSTKGKQKKAKGKAKKAPEEKEKKKGGSMDFIRDFTP